VQPVQISKLLAALDAHGVAFVVVGGVAAVMHGAPYTTFDLDIVHDRSDANVARLLAALAELNARYRDPAGRVLRPSQDGLRGPGQHLLLTNLGPLDILGVMVGDRDFARLAHSATVVLLGSHQVRVIGLLDLIASKRELNRAKDLPVVALLQAISRQNDET